MLAVVVVAAAVVYRVCVCVRACVRAQGKKSHRWHQSSGKKEGGKKESTEICSSDFFRDLVSLEEDERETKQTKTRRKLMGSKNRLKGYNESNLLMPSDAVWSEASKVTKKGEGGGMVVWLSRKEREREREREFDCWERRAYPFVMTSHEIRVVVVCPSTGVIWQPKSDLLLYSCKRRRRSSSNFFFLPFFVK